MQGTDAARRRAIERRRFGCGWQTIALSRTEPARRVVRAGILLRSVGRRDRTDARVGSTRPKPLVRLWIERCQEGRASCVTRRWAA
jgi:hypothetical protein